MTISSIVATIFVISIMVLVHEYGHFFFARLFGVTVYEFAIGFGPALFQWEKKKVQYSIRAIPLGGFTKIAGMDLALEGESERRPGERLFCEIPLAKRVIIILAGSVNNLILAMVTFMFIAAIIGIPYQQQIDRAVIGVVEPKSPAFEAGLSPGDEIVEIEGKSITGWEQITEIIHHSPERILTFKIRRAEQVLVREIKPFYDPGYQVGRIGILPSYTIKRLPFFQSIKFGFLRTWQGLQDIPISLVRMILGRERAGIMGPLGMVGAIDQALQSGAYLFFSMIAGINMFLGVFNLLPIPLPLLDGGWILIMLLERIRKKDFSSEQKATAQMIGLAAMLILFFIATYTDILSLLKRAVK